MSWAVQSAIASSRRSIVSIAIEFCHFYRGRFDPNRRAARVAKQFANRSSRLPMRIGYTPSARITRAFRARANYGRKCFSFLRNGPLRLTSPPSTLAAIADAVYFVFIKHPLTRRRHHAPTSSGATPRTGAQLVTSVLNHIPKHGRRWNCDFLDMKTIFSFVCVLMLVFSGCASFKKHSKKKTPEQMATEERMAQDSQQMDFQGFIGRLARR